MNMGFSMFRYTTKTSNGEFVDEMDILIILDACRYDYFARCNTIKGELSKIRLETTKTLDWVGISWNGKYDITYVSANPLISSKFSKGNYKGGDHFKEVIDVWDFGWSEELRTVHPDVVTRIAREYIDKNLIVHYIQPHAPYIGEPKLNIFSWAQIRYQLLGVKKQSINEEKVEDIELLKEAYIGNLKLVLRSVEKLLKYIPMDKKVVISSDHSELLGEENLIGHNYDLNRQIPIPYLIVRR